MSDKPEDYFPDSPFMRGLPPLRIPGGWNISWNNLDINSKPEDGDLGGSSLFYAVNEGTRFLIDVMFRPEFDPNGSFILEITYRPWPRTEKGRRRKDVPFKFATDDEVVHTFETRSMPELLDQLQHWIARCSIWVREGH
ncbi:MAG TPA: hypothetical protein VEA80_06920 [Vitreimonas sp.]|uniref:hypothetical protein n=1 Tax=Vitreimonas sp. TaxID=3069702 RepID=UPI002D602AA1|nr:hypothetical protein [Vitreimonas sp.]HYD87187.1 hypothetical protein [Vitreimonas sp.]